MSLIEKGQKGARHHINRVDYAAPDLGVEPDDHLPFNLQFLYSHLQLLSYLVLSTTSVHGGQELYEPCGIRKRLPKARLNNADCDRLRIIINF